MAAKPHIERRAALEQTRRALDRSPVVAILGARQCGKTTLARDLAASKAAHWFDLEDPVSLRRLEDPSLTLRPLEGLVVIDEVQRMPELFPLLRVLADRDPLPARFLLLGSASLDLVQRTSETLAGRIEFIELGGFDLWETGVDTLASLWLRGGFPRSFLAASDPDSLVWRESFIRTFLERDVPRLGMNVAAPTMRRFWTMLAHYHGQTWNGAELGRALGVTAPTVRRYLDVLSATFVVRQLQPWFANVGKRQVKSPKVYVRDSGLAHALLGLGTHAELMGHPKAGASWEGFAIEQILRCVPGDPYFWSTHGGAELDLLILRRRERWGFEVKLTDAPKATRSMRVALKDLELDRLFVIHAGDARFDLAEKLTALPLTAVADVLA